MKRLLPFVPLLLLAALLLFPSSALTGAKQGLEIWWGHVFPALLPGFICVKMVQQLGLFQSASRHPKGRMAAVIVFPLMSGAPNGAKLLHTMVQDRALSPRDSERLLPVVNNISPLFLLNIIASDMLENKALFLPMAVAFYGCILCFVALKLLQKRTNSPFHGVRDADQVPFTAVMTSSIESSMLDMLRIGGCILISCTFLSVLQPISPNDGVYALLACLMEVTTGVSILAKLTLSLRLKSSLLIGCAAFGGLSLALQTLCCYPGLRLLPYIVKKLFFGAVVALVSYLLFPLFPNVSPAFASRQQILSRSLSISALLLSSLLSVTFIGLLSLMTDPYKGK